MNNETLKRDLCARLMEGVVIMNIIKEGFTYKLTPVNIEHICNHNKTNKPIFFPTSAITKPIQIASYNNGEPFVPKYELEKILGVYRCDYLMDNLDLIISKNKIPQEKVHFEFIDFVKAIDFLNKIHINYRLSPEQFIEVTDEFNPYL